MPEPDSRPGLLERLLPLLIVFLAYFPSLSESFHNLDDPELTFNNPLLHLPFLDALRKIFTSTMVDIYQPLNVLSLGLEARWIGLDPFVFRLDNILLHLANTFMAGAIARRFGVGRCGCVLAALLFGLHPTRTEAVAWITSRKDVLSGFFFLAGVLCCLEYLGQPRSTMRCGMLVCGLGSMLSKPTTAFYPFVLFLIGFQKGGWTFRRCLLTFLPDFLVLAIVFHINRVLAPADIQAFARMIPVQWRLLMGEIGTGVLIRYLLFPFDLPVLIPQPVSPTEVLGAGHLLEGLFPVLLLYLLVRAPRQSRLYLGAWWFALGMVPIIGGRVTGVLTYELTAIRYLYIPPLGAFIWCGGFFGPWLSDRRVRRGRWWLASLCFAGVFSFFAWQTARLAPLWGQPRKLWERAVGQFPVSRNLLALGRVALVEKDFPAALDALLEAERRFGGQSSHWTGATLDEIRYYASMAHSRLGNVASAQAEILQAIRESPRNARYHHARGVQLLQEGRLPEALDFFQQAQKLDPEFPGGWCDGGLALSRLGRNPEALAALGRARELSPRNPAVLRNTATVLDALGRTDESGRLRAEADRLVTDILDLQGTW